MGHGEALAVRVEIASQGEVDDACLEELTASHYHAPGSYGPGGIIGLFGAIAIIATALQLRSARTRPGPEPT